MFILNGPNYVEFMLGQPDDYGIYEAFTLTSYGYLFVFDGNIQKYEDDRQV